MSTSSWKAESLAPHGIPLPSALARQPTGPLDRLVRESRRRRTYADLAGLDYRTLKDIGLDRGMLLGVSYQASRKPARAARPSWAESWTLPRLRGCGVKLLSSLVALVFEARERAAARDLRRFEACLGPNQLKEFGQHSGDLPFQRLD
jgi:uncharacterized protein YjiS (DUF1127 family)